MTNDPRYVKPRIHVEQYGDAGDNGETHKSYGWPMFHVTVGKWWSVWKGIRSVDSREVRLFAGTSKRGYCFNLSLGKGFYGDRDEDGWPQ